MPSHSPQQIMEHTQRMHNLKLSQVFPHYVVKIQKKGGVVEDLYTIIHWLTGYRREDIDALSQSECTLKDFFRNAPCPQEKYKEIRGMICGYRIEELSDPVVRMARCMDKLIDERSKGKSMEKVLRY